MKHELPCTPVGVAGRLDKLYACRVKSFTESVNVIYAQIQMQMPTFVHKLNGRILRIYEL